MSAPPLHFVAAEHLAVAKHVMLTDFSESIDTLSSFLLCNGPTSLKDLVLLTSLPASLVRNGLLALMQQNIVTCPVLPEVDTSAAAKARRAAGNLPPIVYAASLDEIFGRLWFPRIVLLARDRYGDAAGMLLQELLIHGRMGHDAMVGSAAQAYATSAELPLDSAPVTEHGSAAKSGTSAPRGRSGSGSAAPNEPPGWSTPRSGARRRALGPSGEPSPSLQRSAALPLPSMSPSFWPGRYPNPTTYPNQIQAQPDRGDQGATGGAVHCRMRADPASSHQRRGDCRRRAAAAAARSCRESYSRSRRARRRARRWRARRRGRRWARLEAGGRGGRAQAAAQAKEG